MDKHVLERMQNIMDNLSNANLNDVTELLNYYNGDAVMINGTSYHPFNDPSTAARLNARYHELTGQDHQRFVEQAPIVIGDLMKDKDMLLQTRIYDSSYFDKLEQIKSGIQQTSEIKNTEETKRTFTEERDKQRQFDASVREQQIDAMKQTNQNLQGMQQMVSEINQDNSIGGMSR